MYKLPFPPGNLKQAFQRLWQDQGVKCGPHIHSDISDIWLYSAFRAHFRYRLSLSSSISCENSLSFYRFLPSRTNFHFQARANECNVTVDCSPEMRLKVCTAKMQLELLEGTPSVHSFIISNLNWVPGFHHQQSQFASQPLKMYQASTLISSIFFATSHSALAPAPTRPLLLRLCVYP